jgi:hypothetical protein
MENADKAGLAIFTDLTEAPALPLGSVRGNETSCDPSSE